MSHKADYLYCNGTTSVGKEQDYVIRTVRFGGISVAVAAILISTFVTGCGKKEETTTPPPPANATTQPTTGGAGAGQGKVSTGADPDKAPSYPSMYGKPAGAK